MPSEKSLRRDIAGTCRRMAEQGLAPGTSGNVSARLSRTTLLITPSGCALADVRPADLVNVRIRHGSSAPGKASSELSAHRIIYRSRADAGAVIHAHPAACLGFAMARKDFGKPCNLEVYATMGRPALVPFAPTGEWGDLLMPYLDKADCFLLANHGALTLGRGLKQAQHRLEAMENFARGVIAARLLGGPVPLNRSDLAAIRRFLKSSGLPLPRSLSSRHGCGRSGAR